MLGMKWTAAVTLVLLLDAGFSGSPVPKQSVDGLWRSEGYGSVFEIHGGKLRSFEVTATTCMPGYQAEREDTSIEGSEVTFKTEDGDQFFVRHGGMADHKVLHYVGSASDVRIDRIPKLPASCEHPTPNTPLGNFEVFSRTWSENYILFAQPHAKWDATVAAARARVGDKTAPAELFDIFAGMIEPLHNLHTYIDAPDLKREFRTWKPGTDRLVKDVPGGLGRRRLSQVIPKLLAITDRAYLKTPPRKWCNDQVQYAHVDENTGYLRIVSFNSYSEEPGFASGMAALQNALDEIFSDPQLKALIIDVRINFGGNDLYGVEIASRLATADYLAYTKVARDPLVRKQWTPGDPSMVRPSKRPGFRGPVVELIGPLTISAGETFTEALMGRSPHVVRVGENTQGVFSDVLDRRLPNGWRFGLPNEIYRIADGKTFDLVGIPPDVQVPVFADADVASRKDPAMAKALEILRHH